MLDLLGDEVTTPQGSIAEGILNSMHGFPEWWQSWPRNPRKGGKQQCINKWARYGCANNATHILAHTLWMTTQDDWLRGFIPAPLVYLNQQRWLDWEAEVVRPKEDTLAAIKAHKGAPMPDAIRAKLKELRVNPNSQSQAGAGK